MAGLEDQLLGKLILKEKHELEEQRQQLMEEVQSYKKKIKQLEDDLLFRLSNSQVGRLAGWLQGGGLQGLARRLLGLHPCSAHRAAEQPATLGHSI